MPEARSVVGVFAHVDATVRAIQALRGRGLSDLSVYTPIPVSVGDGTKMPQV